MQSGRHRRTPPEGVAAARPSSRREQSKSSSYWGMSLCKPPSDTSDANSASATRSMIGSGSSRIRRDSRGIRPTCRLVGTDPYQNRLADLAEASVPTEDVASARRLRPLSRLIKVFDEQHFVSGFVVYKFVDCAGGKKHSVTTSAHALLLAPNNVRQGVVW